MLKYLPFEFNSFTAMEFGVLVCIIFNYTLHIFYLFICFFFVLLLHAYYAKVIVFDRRAEFWELFT